MGDFTETYERARHSIVHVTADNGIGLVDSTGFVAESHGRNYIVMAAHGVMRDPSTWGMDGLLLHDDGNKGTGQYRDSGVLNVPAGVRSLLFRFLPDDPAGGVLLDHVIVQNTRTTLFHDDFSAVVAVSPPGGGAAGSPAAAVTTPTQHPAAAGSTRATASMRGGEVVTRRLFTRGAPRPSPSNPGAAILAALSAFSTKVQARAGPRGDARADGKEDGKGGRNDGAPAASPTTAAASGRSGLDARWSATEGAPWYVVRYAGRELGNALRVDEHAVKRGESSMMELQLALDEPTTLRFDYKLEGRGGALMVGYRLAPPKGNTTRATPPPTGRVSQRIIAYLGGEIHPVDIIGLDGKGDIAVGLLRDRSKLDAMPALSFTADSRTIPIATPVATIGNPLSIDAESVAVGVLRDNRYSLPTPLTTEAILTCVSGHSGDSGGPYLLQDGSVAGMLTFGYGEGDASTLNGGPSARVLRHVLDSLVTQYNAKSNGKAAAPALEYIEYQKPYLGLELFAVDLSVIRELDLPMVGSTPTVPPGGYIVMSIADDSPFAGKVQPLDVLMALTSARANGSGGGSGGRGRFPVGNFPGQASPAALTWYMSPQESITLELLRFDQANGQWAPVSIGPVPLAPFPPAKDVPLGRLLSQRRGESGVRMGALLHVPLSMKVSGDVARRRYAVNPNM